MYIILCYHINLVTYALIRNPSFTQWNLSCEEISRFIPEKVKNLIQYDSNESMFSVHLKSLYQSTKGWVCPDRSR